MYWAIEDVFTNCVPKFSTNDAGLIANVVTMVSAAAAEGADRKRQPITTSTTTITRWAAFFIKVSF